MKNNLNAIRFQQFNSFLNFAIVDKVNKTYISKNLSKLREEMENFRIDP